MSAEAENLRTRLPDGKLGLTGVIGSRRWTAQLKAHLRALRRYRLLDVSADLIRSPNARAYWYARLVRPDNLFQPSADTWPNRYPEIFQFARDELGDSRDLRLLSFGCSSGEEVFSLRRYFSTAQITGLDINPLNIAVCRWRCHSLGDEHMSFAVAGSVEQEPPASYDAVFCMAVLRHGDLSFSTVQTCDHRITFQAFDRTVGELARCLKDGGLLVIQHSNFRVCDASAASHLEPVLSANNGNFHPQVPLFGPDNRRLDLPSYPDVVFRKLG